MGEVYCLYSSEDGIPKYIGMTEWNSEKRWKKHISDALEKQPGRLYDWMRSVVRNNEYVSYRVLQTDITPSELNFYEKYWISQFKDLLNVRDNEKPPTDNSEVARNVIVSIKAELVTRGPDELKLQG